MEQAYAVLRDLNRARTGEALDFGLEAVRAEGLTLRGGLSGRRGAPPEPRIDVHSLRPRDVRDMAGEPDVVGVAPVMPVRLIAPVTGKGKAKAGAAPKATARAAAASSWGIHEVGADKTAFTGAGVTVAILDTGIDATHPAFSGVQLVQQDFTGSGNGDVVGHGTHCAGTILGRDVSGTRIGIARGVTRALIGKVLDNTGSGGSATLFRAIQWASQEAQVISMSLGFDFPGMVDDLVTNRGVPVAPATSAALEAYRANMRMFDALMDMLRASQDFTGGTLVIAAAGNESQRPTYEIAASLPAASVGVLSVAALEKKASGLGVTFFSNTLAQISAPGMDIVSAKVGGGLTSMSGTSMACPHVAGIAALWWEAVKASPVPQTAQVVTNKLLASARTTGFMAGVDVADRGNGIATAP